jgi:hypothetical protein
MQELQVTLVPLLTVYLADLTYMAALNTMLGTLQVFSHKVFSHTRH